MYHSIISSSGWFSPVGTREQHVDLILVPCGHVDQAVDAVEIARITARPSPEGPWADKRLLQ